MGRGRSTVAVVAAVLLLTGCTGDDPAPTPAPTPSARPVALWESDLTAVEKPLATASGFAFHTYTDAAGFEAVNLDAATGAVRWRAPASPSIIAGGSGVKLEVVASGALVVWMRPGIAYDAGVVTLVAADEATGKEVWAFGDGRLRIQSAPAPCRDGKALCFVGERRAGRPSSFMVLEAATGELLLDRPLGGAASFRALEELLRDDGTNLVGVTEEGEQLWARPYASVYGGADVSPDEGWNFGLRDGRFVGSLGYPSALVAPLTVGRAYSVDLTRLGATAAFDARTGATRWVKPDASVQCGAFEFDVAHPMWCVQKGTWTATATDATHLGPATYAGLDITLEGFDPATGRPTWSWHAGAEEGLRTGDDVLRLDDTTYAVRAGGRSFVLDLDRGAQEREPPSVGWCFRDEVVEPPKQRQVRGVEGYRMETWYACAAGGKAVDVPATAPAFVGTPVRGVLAWPDENGAVRGSRVAG
jgi:outer membrane protein assembly factor BamB